MKALIRKLLVVISFAVVFGAFVVLSSLLSQKHLPTVFNKPIGSDEIGAQAYFSPDDDLRSLFISLIDAESIALRFAIYTITDKQIAQAFIRAAQRGVKVEGVVDRSYGQSRFSKVAVLANAQIPIWVYQTSSHERDAGLMHNKFCLFSNTIDNQALVWTGSYNFTRRASEKNQENIIVLSSVTLFKRYEDYFDRLKVQSLQISGKVMYTQPRGQVDNTSLIDRLTGFLS